MQPPVSRSTALAACILAMGAAAAFPAGAAPADAGGEDAGLDAQEAGSPSADASDGGIAAAEDATLSTPDATVSPMPTLDAAGAAVSTAGFGSYVMDDGGFVAYSGVPIFQALCIDNPDAATFTYANVATPYTTPAECTTFIAGQTAARTCLCQNPDCFVLQQQCDALQGCRAIQKCGLETGCNDPNSCYLIQGLCAAPIDNAGTGSVSTALSQLLENCGKSHNCPTK